MVSINMLSEQKTFPLIHSNASPPINAVASPPMNAVASPPMSINASPPLSINASPPINAVPFPPMNINTSPLMNRNALIINSPSCVICNTFILNSEPFKSQRKQTEQRKARKKTKIDENEVFQFMQEHSETKTRLKYGIGHKRYIKIKEFHGKYPNKKKTTLEIVDYIVEIASTRRLAVDISLAIEKKFNIKISQDTVIRRLRENHFKYRKLQSSRFDRCTDMLEI